MLLRAHTLPHTHTHTHTRMYTFAPIQDARCTHWSHTHCAWCWCCVCACVCTCVCVCTCAHAPPPAGPAEAQQAQGTTSARHNKRKAQQAHGTTACATSARLPFLQVQLRHNKRKAEAIKKLLAAEAGGEAEGEAGQGATGTLPPEAPATRALPDCMHNWIYVFYLASAWQAGGHGGGSAACSWAWVAKAGSSTDTLRCAAPPRSPEAFVSSKAVHDAYACAEPDF